MKKSNIGGQGVLEGVMMRAPEVCGLAVRKAKGEIVYEKENVKSATKKNKFYGLPVVRGVVSFVDMMGYGVKTLTKSAKLYDDTTEDYKPSKFETFVAKKTGKDIMDVAMVFAVILAIGLAVGIFFILPSVLTNIVRPYIASSIVMNLIEGGIRLIIFFLYVTLITLLKDIKRVFMYHGAEHKTINCYEHEEDLTVENIQKHKTLHPRCGTSYLLLVMVISILLFSLLGWSPAWYARIGLRLLMLPVVAGVAYEFLKFAARGESLFFRVIRWPGMMLQKLTTAEPDDSMVEVAIVAFTAAMDEMSKEELDALAKSFYRPATKKAAEQDKAGMEEAEETGANKDE
ncbi:MAG: DUF1385 domain-containing protein [Eubacteriales bacterium]|nr:DUF1385 domain-containing protein [Eubacteriales bacterium]